MRSALSFYSVTIWIFVCLFSGIVLVDHSTAEEDAIETAIEEVFNPEETITLKGLTCVYADFDWFSETGNEGHVGEVVITPLIRWRQDLLMAGYGYSFSDNKHFAAMMVNVEDGLSLIDSQNFTLTVDIYAGLFVSYDEPERQWGSGLALGGIDLKATYKF